MRLFESLRDNKELGLTKGVLYKAHSLKRDGIIGDYIVVTNDRGIVLQILLTEFKEKC